MGEGKRADQQLQTRLNKLHNNGSSQVAPSSEGETAVPLTGQ